MSSSGRRAQPFWSTRMRVERIIKNVPAYAGFEPVEIAWAEFRDHWLPGLEREGILVGTNWSGKAATGYDLEPASVRHCIEIEMQNITDTGDASPSCRKAKLESVGPE